jgi:hypothetical protein
MNTVFLFGAAQKSSLLGLFAGTHKTQPQYSQSGKAPPSGSQKVGRLQIITILPEKFLRQSL